MAALKFRGSSTTPTKPGATTAANTPLTNVEIDGNFASLNDTKLEIGTNATTFVTGDIIYASAANTLLRLPIGTGGHLLTVTSGLPAWQPAPISLPTQTGNSGKLLTTDGTTASWITAANTDTTQVVRTDKFLQSPYQPVAPRGLLYRGTGALTSLGTNIVGTNPIDIAIDPTCRFMYVTNNGSNTVSQFSINQSTGALTSIATAVATGSLPQGIAVDPTGRFLYVANSSAASPSLSSISQYSINQTTGALTAMATATVATGTQSYNLAIDPTGRFLYSSNFGANTVTQFSINQSTGALTYGSVINSNGFPEEIAVDPTGRFVYVGSTNGTVGQYLINQTTGALTSIGTITVGSPSGIYDLVIDPTGRFVYLAHYGENTIGQYSINQSTGVLTLITTPVSTGNQPDSIAIDPTGRFAYAVNFGGNNVSQYSINQSTGALTALSPATVIASTNPASIIVDATGRFAYVANYGTTVVTRFSINSFNGGASIGVSSLSIRDTSAAFDVTIGATSSTTLTNNRALTIDMVNAARTIKLAGNIDIAGNVTHAGGFNRTFTATATTTLTLPITGTLATLAGTETFTNKTISSGTLSGTLTAGASVGSNGQVLTSTGSGVQWSTIAAGITLTDDTSTSTSTNYLTFTTATSGTISSAKVTSTKLYFQPSTGTLSSTIFTATSDVRFKTDLEKIKGGLSKVKQLTGYTFTMIDSGQRSAGLLAQDVKPVSPESIGGTEDKMTLNYDSLLGLIVEAIKDIDDKLTIIEQRLDK